MIDIFIDKMRSSSSEMIANFVSFEKKLNLGIAENLSLFLLLDELNFIKISSENSEKINKKLQ